MDQRNQSTESQNIAEDAVGGQFAAIRRVSARLARRVNREFRVAHSIRAHPNHSNIQHFDTWWTQNRQMERQRNYYSHYYLSNRNRNFQSNINNSRPNNSESGSSLTTVETPTPVSNPVSVPSPTLAPPQISVPSPTLAPPQISVPSTTLAPPQISVPSPTLVPLQISVPSQISEPSPVSTLSPVSVSSVIRAVDTIEQPMVERFANIIHINNAATQTIINSNSVDDAGASVSVENNLNTNSLFAQSYQDYLGSIGAYFTYSHVGRSQTFTPHRLDDNGNLERRNPTTLAMEPINIDAFFGIDLFQNDGLTKQEINRHTVSYEYKLIVPTKRKRKTDKSSSLSSTSENENCSICLDKFNSNVHVRRLPCLHVFHSKCIDKWLNRSRKCPICRISITINYDTLIDSLQSGSTIDQCITQQERVHNRSRMGPTITLSLQRNGNNQLLAQGIVHATLDLNSNTTTGINGDPTPRV